MTQRALPALLDVNLLVALFDPDHVHHEVAHDWFTDHRHHGWATCPLTENGVVRILSNRRYSPVAESPARTLERLRAFCESGDHRFWAEDVSMREHERFIPSAVLSHQKITDVYLLGLALKHGGRLATFDRTIPLGAVRGAAADDLLIVGSV